MSTATEFMSGFTGCKVLSGTGANTGRWQGFVVNADAVVSAALDKNAASVMTTLGLTGVTLKQGTFISLPEGDYFSSITLTSGSIVAYNV
jgi:hypothetical protein